MYSYNEVQFKYMAANSADTINPIAEIPNTVTVRRGSPTSLHLPRSKWPSGRCTRTWRRWFHSSTCSHSFTPSLSQSQREPQRRTWRKRLLRGSVSSCGSDGWWCCVVSTSTSRYAIASTGQGLVAMLCVCSMTTAVNDSETENSYKWYCMEVDYGVDSLNLSALTGHGHRSTIRVMRGPELGRRYCTLQAAHDHNGVTGE